MRDHSPYAQLYGVLCQALLDEKDNSGDGFHVVNRGPDDGRWAEIAQLLSRKRNVIHPLQALELLPGEVRNRWPHQNMLERGELNQSIQTSWMPPSPCRSPCTGLCRFWRERSWACKSGRELLHCSVA